MLLFADLSCLMLSAWLRYWWAILHFRQLKSWCIWEV